MNYWDQKTFCLITGASRGLGRTIAIEFAKNVGSGSVFLLVARSADALESTKKSIEDETAGKCQVVTAPMDLGTPDKNAIQEIIKSALATTNSTAADFQHSLLVHNAGSLGIEKQLKVIELDDLSDIHSYFSFNVYSMIILTTQFFKIFNDSEKQRSIVQITSLGGVQPFKTWGLYCAGKAARDMLMKSVAEESGIQVISWAPGPVQTDMYDQAVQQTGDKELQTLFSENQQQGSVLTAQQTIIKLIKVLREGKYVKGEHVDYYDIE